MPPRNQVDLSNVEVDFSGVAKPAQRSAAELLLATSGAAGEAAQDASSLSAERRAYDPRMKSYVERHAQLGARRRRRQLFTPAAAAEQTTSTEKAQADTLHSTNEEGTEEDVAARQQRVTALLTAQEQAYSSAEQLQRRKAHYLRDLRDFCHCGLPTSETTTVKSSMATSHDDENEGEFPCAATQSNSLLAQLFADGVPDIEPWDRWAFELPRYDMNALTIHLHDRRSLHEQGVDAIHTEVLPDTYYTRHYQYAGLSAEEIAQQQDRLRRLCKTKDELRAERRARLREKQLRAQRERAATGAAAPQDRLSTRTLATQLFTRSVLNPLGAENKVLDQYQQRFLDHQRRNHERHVAALPAQILKRERDVARHATTQPLLRAYRVFPIYSPAHLAKVRHFANDNQLRGFVLWVAQCDALVVLEGGEVAARHLDRWLLHKMRWESEETRAVRLCSLPLPHAHTLSFHLKSTRQKDTTNTTPKTSEADGHEAVYMNFVDTVRQGEAFLRSLPAAPSPWKDLAALWRLAFLRDGLQSNVEVYGVLAMAPPPYSDEANKYNLNTFWGRTRYWAAALNPLFLFETERSARNAQLLLDSWRHGQASEATSKELWHARAVIEACVHPTTEEVIFPLFRMCCFLPANFLIVPFMMAPSTVTSISRTLFIQWFNQSYNAAINYANRSSDRQPMRELAKAYTAAVIVACGGSLAATLLLRKVPTTSTSGMLIRATVPFLAVSCAAIVNLAFMRRNEWQQGGQGIAVTDEDGVVRGHSTQAGWDSLKKCSATRVAWNVPSMVLPTLLMLFLPRCLGVARTHPVMLESVLQCLGLAVGVPPALALFALRQHIDVRQLELRFQDLKRLDGSPVQRCTYYKGL